MLVILIASVCCYFGSGIYMFFNNNFDSKPKCAYVSEISYIPNTHWFDESIFFLSPEGKEKEYYEFFDFDMLDLSEDFEEGRAIYVEEYEGAFGVEHYVIREENDG